MKTGSNILIVLGGTWHDFEGFKESMKSTLGAEGHHLDATYDLDALKTLDAQDYDIVMLDTCLSGTTEEGDPGPGFTAAQAEALSQWVANGGNLLAVHAATVSGQTHPTFGTLMGGVFIEHPPQFSFTVYPTFREHPITAGVRAFAVHDEFYIQDYNADIQIHMVAVDRGKAYPMVWTRSHGDGQVAYVGMGHDEEVWALKPYKKLMRQAVSWLTKT